MRPNGTSRGTTLVPIPKGFQELRSQTSGVAGVLGSLIQKKSLESSCYSHCGHVNLKHSKPPPNFGIVFAVPYKALRLIHVFKHPSGMPSASCEVLEKKRIPVVEGNKEAYDHIFVSTSININHIPMLILVLIGGS